MKRDKIVYWISTGIVALMGFTAGVMYFNSPVIAKEFGNLGFPDYFRIELGTAKLIGAIILFFPIFPYQIKEWAYAGFTIVFISASIAHISVEGLPAVINPVISLSLLVISYLYFNKIKKYKAELKD
jgi:DoxX-like family